jgi:hypothetical protein
VTFLEAIVAANVNANVRISRRAWQNPDDEPGQFSQFLWVWFQSGVIFDRDAWLRVVVDGESFNDELALGRGITLTVEDYQASDWFTLPPEELADPPSPPTTPPAASN